MDVLENNSHTAVSFHSTIVEEFDARYKTNINFKERFQIWTDLIDRHSAPTHKTLDLGCGSGVFTNYLARHNEHVTAIDASPDMVAHCKKKNDEHGLKNVRYITGDITKISDETQDKYNLITCSSVLEYIEDIDIVLAQIPSLLAENGIVLMSVPNHSSFFRKVEPYLHKYIGRPRYYKYVKTVLTLKKMRQHLAKHGLTDTAHHYYARTRILSPLCRKIGLRKYSDNQYVLVCKKTA